MEKSLDINAILAKNIRFFMKLKKTNPNALAIKEQLSANTIRNAINYKARPKADNEVGYPTLGKLELLATRLGVEVWELLHPDIEKSLREREFYRKMEADFAEIQAKDKGKHRATV